MVVRRVLIGLAAFFALLLVVAIGGYVWLDSQSGRAFVARQVAGFELENGLRFKVGRIEGSIYGETVLKDVRLLDTKGEFARLPVVNLDWSPFAYLRNHVDIDALTAPEMSISRKPLFKVVPDTGEPLLPDIDIDIDRLKLDRIVLAEAVTGRRQVASLQGKIKIADRRAIVTATGGTIEGDRLVLKLDAVPEANRFDVGLQMTAPVDGLIAGMAGSATAFAISLDGKGNWDRWNGVLKAKAGADALADVALTARAGRFTAKGTVQPSLVLAKGIISDAFAPSTTIDLAATFADRRADIEGSLASAALSVTADGVVDMAKGGFDDLALDIKLLRPSLLAANVSGQNVAGKVLLNGSFAEPVIAYTMTANRLTFDATTLEGFSASGEAGSKGDRVVIPVNARARRVLGLDVVGGGPIANVRMNGDLAYAEGRILSDNMKIRSDRINATAIILADLNKGIYTSALKGKVNGYRVETVGLFNVDADVDLETQGRTGFALAGTIRARSTRIFSPGFQNFLGGQTFVKAGIRYGTNGLLTITRASVVAPQFRLNSGAGTYRVDSEVVRFTGSGFSNRYGPVGVAVTGTFDKPVIRVTASKPGMGVGLSNIVAIVTRNRSGYAITAMGDTTYGPVSGDFYVLSGNGPLTIDVKRGDFAGVGVSGRLRQAAAGPFVGTLVGTGSGFDGTIALSSQGQYQRLVVDATALNARLTGAQPLSVGRAIIDADIVLYDSPQILADVQVEDASMNNISLAVARAKIDYRAGSGTAQVLAEGRSQVPFRVAANAELTPKLWRIAAKGRANSINFSTASPVRIILGRTDYEILPATINIADGSVQLAGRYGQGLEVQSRLNKVDLAVLNPMLAGLGIGGRASGSLDWSQSSFAAFPRADARLEITRFTRVNLGSASQPVDISLVGRLLPEGGNMRAVVRRRGAAVGRLQVDLKPLPPGMADWTTRLLAAPLSGGIRYNGPADTLFSLAALSDQSLTGNIGVAADFSGLVRSPRLTGVVRANDLVYENDVYGTRLTNLRVRGVFTNDQLEVTELSAKAGNGTITGKGFVSLSSAQGFPVQLNLDVNNARLARSEMIATEATGTISVTNTAAGGALVSGTLQLPETRFKIIRQGAAKVATLTGVRRKPTSRAARVTGDADAITSLPSNWRLDIKLVADDKLYVSGMGLESEWRANLRVTGTSDAPNIAGDMQLIRGTLGFAGRSFELESGRLLFDGGPASNPSIRVVAASEVDGSTVRVNIRGTGQNPAITFSSTPALPQDEIMARILFGNSIGELTAIQAIQLAGSLNALRGGSGGLNPMGVLQSATGLDRLRILGADEKTGRGTAVAFGQYITNDVYVEIVTDARGYTASQIEISLTRALSVLSQISSQGSSNVNVRYKKDY